MRLGQQLRDLRESQRKSLKEIAEKANLSVTKLSKLELGDRGLDVDDFIVIAQSLGYRPGDLLDNSAGLYAEFRPLLDRLRTVPTERRRAVADTLIAILQLRDDAVAETIMGRETASAVTPYTEAPPTTDDRPAFPPGRTRSADHAPAPVPGRRSQSAYPGRTSSKDRKR